MIRMIETTLEEYRCFHERQVARLAPLTLLVGDNSTGKTSFLALLRVLWESIFHSHAPDFKAEPCDIGSFDEIAHHRGARGGRASSFKAGFRCADSLEAEITFGKLGAVPVPTRVRLADGASWIVFGFEGGRHNQIEVGTRRGTWERASPENLRLAAFSVADALSRLDILLQALMAPNRGQVGRAGFKPVADSPVISRQDATDVSILSRQTASGGNGRPFASAPVRSKPRRTYDPARTTPDPEGDYVPMYLAELASQDRDRAWTQLKPRLEAFGKDAGLFDQITVRRLGDSTSGPFQVQVRKFGNRLKGPQRNLIDMGYGVSQVLPVVTEMLREHASTLFLLQQPEVHLHPSAQAALGSLFCTVASEGRQLVVETHSDHLMDRIRMDVRDRKTPLKPKEVSILFFERNELDVHIHSLRLDEDGNVLGAPRNYRKFFMDETRRLLNL